MRAEVYKQSYPDHMLELDLTEADIAFGFCQILCSDCGGTGEFLVTEEVKEPCVNCKTSGFVWVTLC